MDCNDQNINGIIHYLQQTMSPNDEIRNPAEKNLIFIESNQNYPLLLLHIIDKQDVEFVIRTAAAITFKNYIKRNWIDNDGVRISHQDRIAIKKSIIGVMLKKEGHIQRQLSDAVAIIGKEDFPEKWTHLLPELIDRIKSSCGNFQIINGILQTCHSLFKRFRHEFKSDELWSVIKYVLDKFASPFTDLFVATMNLSVAHSDNLESLKVIYSSLLLCSKIFYSLNVQDLPEFFEDNLVIWMPSFLNLLSIENKMLESDNDEEPGLLEQLKSEICNIISMFAQKYHDEFETYLHSFVECVWKLLVNSNKQPKYDLLVSNAIKFLSTVANRPQFKKLFEEHGVLDSLCSKVIIPNIEFRQCDIELFEDNPEEYIVSDIEGSDVETRRRSACELVKSLAKHFESEIIRVFSEYIKAMLESFASDPNNFWKNKDAAIYLVTAICVKGTTQKYGTTKTTNLVNIVDFYNIFVKGDIENSNDINSLPILRADALKYVMTFRNQLPFDDVLIPLLPTIIRHLSAQSVVVHTYAAHTIERIFAMKNAEKNHIINQEQIKTVIQPLMSSLLQTLTLEGSSENEYVMRAIMRVMAVSQDVVLPYLNEVLPQITSKLAIVCKNPTKPYFNHYLFESIAVIIRLACSKDPSAVNNFETILFPMFETVANQDVQEFVPYVLQLLSLLLELNPVRHIPENYLRLLSGITAPTLWEKSGNVNPLVRFLKAYIVKSPQQIIDSGRLQAILGIFQKLVASKSNDHEGLDLLQCLFDTLPPETLKPFVNEIFILLFTRISNSKTAKFVKSLLVFFSFFIYKFGPETLENIVDQIQSKMFSMVIEKLYIFEVQKVSGNADRKICAVAIVKMLCELPSIIDGPNSVFWPKLLETLIALFELPELEEDIFEDVELDLSDELSYKTTYSKLMFAPNPTKDIFDGSIPCAKIYLASCLHKFSLSKPGTILSVIEKNIPPAAIEHLKKYFEVANLTLV